MTLARRSAKVKQIAGRFGFDYCGIAMAELLEEEAPRLADWLKKGYHGKMRYMENHFDKRLDPTKLVPGAKSVISLIYNYYPDPELHGENENGKVAKYAYGTDYHDVIRPILKDLLVALNEEIGEVNGRVFVDSAPVMERQWAARSGAGWLGKNTLLLHPTKGSFFFLAELIVDIELAPDGPIKDYCGTCTKCMEACPTDAFPAPYVLDASKCISYLTIELRDEIPVAFDGQMENWVFGCDICQDVCPWNRFSTPHEEPAFELIGESNTGNIDWLELTEEVYAAIKDTPLSRAGLDGLKRNAAFLKKQKKIPPESGTLSKH